MEWPQVLLLIDCLYHVEIGASCTEDCGELLPPCVGWRKCLTHVKLTRHLTFQGYQPVPSSASLQDCIHIIQSLPDDDSPEILGIHPEATHTCSEIKSQKFIENLITMQPKAAPVNLMIK